MLICQKFISTRIKSELIQKAISGNLLLLLMAASSFVYCLSDVIVAKLMQKGIRRMTMAYNSKDFEALVSYSLEQVPGWHLTQWGLNELPF